MVRISRSGLRALARTIGYTQVSASHEVSPLMKLVSRGDTTVVDAYLSKILRRYVGEVETVTWNTAKLGERTSSADYVRATQTAHRLGRQIAAFHTRYDVLLTPGLGQLPVKLGWIDMMMDDVEEYWRRVFAFSPFTVWFNLTGQPAMMLPIGHSRSGLPVAVQLVARYGDESTLFRLGSQLEAARPWFARKPALAS